MTAALPTNRAEIFIVIFSPNGGKLGNAPWKSNLHFFWASLTNVDLVSWRSSRYNNTATLLGETLGRLQRSVEVHSIARKKTEEYLRWSRRLRGVHVSIIPPGWWSAESYMYSLLSTALAWIVWRLNHFFCCPLPCHHQCLLRCCWLVVKWCSKSFSSVWLLEVRKVKKKQSYFSRSTIEPESLTEEAARRSVLHGRASGLPTVCARMPSKNGCI